MAEENEYVIGLMQDVSDKLTIISKQINQNESTKDEISVEKSEEFKKVLSGQSMINNNLTNMKESLEELISKNKPVLNQNYKSDYILFGKDSPFSSKLLLILIAVILMCIPAFKYIPEHLNQSSELKEQRDTYKLFYDSFLLSSFDKTGKVPTEIFTLMEKIESRDTVFINYVDRLSTRYKHHLRKVELKAELQSLGK